MKSEVETVEGLEAIVGARPLGARMKSLDAVDDHCERLLKLALFGVIGFCERSGRARAATIGGGGEGGPAFVEVLDRTQIRISLEAPIDLDEAVGCAVLFLIPGLGETLRISGRATIEGRDLKLRVEEAFVHCAKAILRSALWGEPQPSPTARLSGASGLLSTEGLEILSCTSFVVLTSWDKNGAADASPKGDPPGFLAVDRQGRVVVADRPGNRRTDTFHNILEQPRVALLALLPGDDRVVEVSGRATLSTDPELLAPLAVQDKTPKLALCLEVEAENVRASPSVRAADLWSSKRHVSKSEQPKMAKVFADHVKQSKEKGIAAAAIRRLVSPSMMERKLEKSYDKGRY